MKLHIVDEFDNGLDDVIDTVNIIAKEYTDQLDECIDEVKDLLKNKDDLTIEQLNYYISYIPVLLYSITDKMQDLGVKNDAAKMQRKQMFNEIYNKQEHGTVAQRTAIAQMGSNSEQMIEDVFNRVYKKCEDKIEVAKLLHGSLKKILQWRISELEVTRTNIINSNLL